MYLGFYVIIFGPVSRETIDFFCFSFLIERVVWPLLAFFFLYYQRLLQCVGLSSGINFTYLVFICFNCFLFSICFNFNLVILFFILFINPSGDRVQLRVGGLFVFFCFAFSKSLSTRWPLYGFCCSPVFVKKIVSIFFFFLCHFYFLLLVYFYFSYFIDTFLEHGLKTCIMLILNDYCLTHI